MYEFNSPGWTATYEQLHPFIIRSERGVILLEGM